MMYKNVSEIALDAICVKKNLNRHSLVYICPALKLFRRVILSDVLLLQKSCFSLLEAKQQSTESTTHLNGFKLSN